VYGDDMESPDKLVNGFKLLSFYYESALPKTLFLLTIRLDGMRMSDSLVIIPTYQRDREHRKPSSARFFRYRKIVFDVLIVDDNSPDGTADIVTALNARSSKAACSLKQRTKKSGLGTAYVAGFKWALSHQLRICFRNGRRLLAQPRRPGKAV
jgi:hypothetical protein